MSHPVPALKPRPSGWWFVLGVGLIVLAIAAAIALFIWTFSSFFHTDARVAADGQAHQVTVDTDGDRMIWTESPGSLFPPECTVVDHATGDQVPLRHVSGEFRRNNGTSGGWVGTYRFDPGSGHLEVTCTTDGFGDATTTSYVEIGPSPSFGGLAGGILLSMLVPGLLGLTGVAVLIVTGIFFATRPPRRKTVRPGTTD